MHWQIRAILLNNASKLGLIIAFRNYVEQSYYPSDICRINNFLIKVIKMYKIRILSSATNKAFTATNKSL